jgi:predicted RNA-binding protein with PUA-like domain
MRLWGLQSLISDFEWTFVKTRQHSDWEGIRRLALCGAVNNMQQFSNGSNYCEENIQALRFSVVPKDFGS